LNNQDSQNDPGSANNPNSQNDPGKHQSPLDRVERAVPEGRGSVRFAASGDQRCGRRSRKPYEAEV
jgi:hypothetical protein